MRGKLPVGGAVASRGRIIPAHAGQTPCPKAGVLQWTDHPRACGANFKTWVKQTENHGSSPRMRGKRVRARASATRARIIPAHAGQTHRMQRGFMAGPDHPRACGANVHTAYQLRFPAGSSPRMRGKRLHDRCHRQRGRIIPAHAGQTFTSENGLASLTDHPRACGANGTCTIRYGTSAGSSPRMRGKRHHRLRHGSPKRIIPAHAGQTSSPLAAWFAETDHPRACGANSMTCATCFHACGSSPRMRGKRLFRMLPVVSVRIIPAHAGQTVRFYAKTLERWTLNNWIRTVAPIFVLLFLPPVIGQNAYIERHYSNQSFSWFSKLHYASAFDLSLVA